MNFHRAGIIGLTTLATAACSPPQAASVRAEPRSTPSVAMEVNTPATVTAAVNPQRVVRIVDKDPDGDGIANRRIVITETFDPSGVLLESVREVDVEADGIFDSREVTTYGE